MLDLVDNKIISIDEDAFNRLDGLLLLRISKNFLTAADATKSINSNNLQNSEKSI